MRRLVFVLAFAVVLTAMLCGGCAGRRMSVAPEMETPAASTPVTGVDLPLPDPADVLAAAWPARSTAAAELLHTGREFMPGLCQNVEARQNNALFTPAWDGPDATFAEMSYAIYRFDVEGFTDHTELGQLRLRLTWDRAPVDRADCWLALCDWDSARWQVFPGPLDDVLQPQGGFGPYLTPSTSELYVAVVLSGTASAELFKLSFSESLQSDWWMSGANAQHTSRSRMVGPQNGKLQWQFRSCGPSGEFSDPLVAPDGTIYVCYTITIWVVNGWSTFPIFMGLNPDGTRRWERYDYISHLALQNPQVVLASGRWLAAYSPGGEELWRSSSPDWSMGPALATDGTIYAGKYHQLGAFSADGADLWTYQTAGAIVSGPSVAQDGTIFVGCVVSEGDSTVEKLVAVKPDGTLKWEYVIGDMLPKSGYCTPVPAVDGTVYIGSSSGDFHAINPDGSGKWVFPAGAGISSSPAIAVDGTIYFGSDDKRLYALNPDGTEKWHANTVAEVRSAVQLDSAGTIYVSDIGGYLYKIKPDGHFAWYYKTDASVATRPAVAADGTVYFGGDDQRLYAIDADGNLKWNYMAGWDCTSSPAFAADGTVYAGSKDGNLYALNPDGSLQWARAIEESFVGPTVGAGKRIGGPAVGSDGTVYIGSADTYFYALRPNGAIKWTYVAESAIQAGPAIGADGTIYVSCVTGKLIALTPEGEQLWIYPSATGTGEPFSSPALSLDGTIYVCSKESRLYAVNPDGTEKWHRSYQGYLGWAPVVSPDGTLYFSSTDHKLRAVSPDGTLLWTFTPKSSASSFGAPALARDGTIVVADGEGYVYALDPAGQQIWCVHATAGSPTIDAEGTIYLGSRTHISALNPDGSIKWSEVTAVTDAGPFGPNVGTSLTIGPDGRLYCGVGYDIACYGDR